MFLVNILRTTEDDDRKVICLGLNTGSLQEAVEFAELWCEEQLLSGTAIKYKHSVVMIQRLPTDYDYDPEVDMEMLKTSLECHRG